MLKIISLILLIILFILGLTSYIRIVSNDELIQSKIIDMQKEYELIATNEKTYSVLLEYTYNNNEYIYKTKLSNCNLGQEILFYIYNDNIYFISDYIVYIISLICICLTIIINYLNLKEDFLHKKKVLN